MAGAGIKRQLARHLPQTFLRWLRLSASFDVFQRHMAAVRAGLGTSNLDAHHAGTAPEWLLDVGGGGVGIACCADRQQYRVIQLDLAYASLTRGNGSMAVQADGRLLPFANGSIDVVTSVHSVEHVPSELRQQFIDELKRVHRDRLVIVTPAGSNAEWVSRWFIRTLQGLRLEVPRAALEHLECGVPAESWLVKQFPRGEISWRRNKYVELVNAVLTHLPVVRYATMLVYIVALRQFDDVPPFCELVIADSKY